MRLGLATSPAAGGMLSELRGALSDAGLSGRAASTRAPHRRALQVGIAAAVVALAAFFAATRGADALGILDRAVNADWRWVALAAVSLLASLLGYVLLLRAVLHGASARLGLRASYDLALGGAAATRLVPTAGMGGLAVSIWALRAAGLDRRLVAERMVAFLVLLYSVYMLALLTGGTAVAVGTLDVDVPFALPIAAALLGAIVIAAALAVLTAPSSVERVAGRVAPRPASAALPIVGAGVSRAATHLRRPVVPLLGAFAWWGFDIGVLWCTFQTFGTPPAEATLVLAYFLGSLANLVPLPGAMSTGMVGVQIAFGVDPGLALSAVLAYRAITIWLPAVLGLGALVSLRRSVVAWRREDAGS